MKRTMIPALRLVERRWQAANTVASASSTRRTSFAKLLHIWRVTASSSFSVPSTPWMTRFHFLLWTSSSSCLRARPSASCDMCAVMAGRRVVTADSSRSLVNCIDLSTSAIRSLSCTSCCTIICCIVSDVEAKHYPIVEADSHEHMFA